MSVINSDDKILRTWRICRDVYLQNGIKINFPKNTDPRKTYIWRYLNKISITFDNWNLDEDTLRQCVDIAVKNNYNKASKTSLSSLCTPGTLDNCYKKLLERQNRNEKDLEILQTMKEWTMAQINNRDALKVMTVRPAFRTLPLIVQWYQSSKISELFISLSKSCYKAVMFLKDKEVERNLLPSQTSLYIVRMNFLIKQNDLAKIKHIFKEDWRQ